MNTDKKSIPELSYEIINGIWVILDMRHHPPKNVGLIKPVPFGRGWHFCPWIKTGIFFGCLRSDIPKNFRTAERGWQWIEKYFSHFKETRKYTIFNPVMKWIAYAPNLFYILRDVQLQLIFIKVVLGVGAGLYAFQTDTQSIQIGFAVLAAILGITVLTDLGLFIHKWRSQK